MQINRDFIAGVRKKLDLDQREAGEIFGGAVNAFSRYWCSAPLSSVLSR